MQGRPVTRNWLTRVRHSVIGAPVPVKILLVALVIIFAVPLVSVALLVALGYAPYGLATRQRSVLASGCVALWGIVVIVALAHGAAEPRYLLLLLPVAVVVLSHLGVLGRWPVPCRTVAWALLWSLPVGIAAIRVWHSQPLLGPAMAWPIALVVVGWRFVKALQDSRQYGRVTDGIALPAPYALAAVGPAVGAVPVSPPARSELAGHASLARAAQPAAVSRSAGSGQPAGRAVAHPDAEWTHITVDAAMAELLSLIHISEPTRP